MLYAAHTHQSGSSDYVDMPNEDFVIIEVLEEENQTGRRSIDVIGNWSTGPVRAP